MRYGKYLVINLDTIVPAFKTDYNLPENKLPLSDLIFDRSKFISEDKNYREILHPEEDHNEGLYGSHTTAIEGTFTAKDDFNIIILHRIEDENYDDSMVQMLLD